MEFSIQFAYFIAKTDPETETGRCEKTKASTDSNILQTPNSIFYQVQILGTPKNKMWWHPVLLPYRPGIETKNSINSNCYSRSETLWKSHNTNQECLKLSSIDGEVYYYQKC